jgi:threonine/homoserine/homoserine lactone efflux protein
MTLALPGLELLIPFIATVGLIELTPGPNMGYLAIVSGRWGRTAGLATVAGVTLGLFVYLAASVAGVAEWLVSTRWLYESIRWLGCAYLVWLAVETWRGEKPVRAGEEMPRLHPWRLFLRGFAANVLNPKNALFYAVLLPGFIEPARGPVALQALALGLIHLAVATFVHGAIVLTAAGLHPTVAGWDERGGGSAVRRVFALALLAVAVWMMWETRAS